MQPYEDFPLRRADTQATPDLPHAVPDLTTFRSPQEEAAYRKWEAECALQKLLAAQTQACYAAHTPAQDAANRVVLALLLVAGLLLAAGAGWLVIEGLRWLWRLVHG